METKKGSRRCVIQSVRQSTASVDTKCLLDPASTETEFSSFFPSSFFIRIRIQAHSEKHITQIFSLQNHNEKSKSGLLLGCVPRRSSGHEFLIEIPFLETYTHKTRKRNSTVPFLSLISNGNATKDCLPCLPGVSLVLFAGCCDEPQSIGLSLYFKLSSTIHS